MYRHLLFYFFMLIITNFSYASETKISDLLDNREIQYEGTSKKFILPKIYNIDQETFKESIEHAKIYKQDIEETISNYINYSLETEFWNSIEDKKDKESILYLFSAIQNGALSFIDSFRYTLTDIDPEIIGTVKDHSISDKNVLEKMQKVVSRLENTAH